MACDIGRDVYICHGSRELKVTDIKRQKTKTGYERKTTVYGCGLRMHRSIQAE